VNQPNSETEWTEIEVRLGSFISALEFVKDHFAPGDYVHDAGRGVIYVRNNDVAAVQAKLTWA
jgi:hypothetical protein